MECLVPSVGRTGLRGAGCRSVRSVSRGGMSGLRVTRTTSRTMCGGRSVPSFGCSVPDRSAVGSSGRCEMLGGFVGQVVCAGIAGPDRCVQPRGSVDCRLPGLPGLSGRSGLSGLACPICPVCVRFARLVRLVRLFRVVRFLPVRLLSVRTARPVRSVCSARCGPSRPAFRSGRPLLLFVYSSRPAFSVPSGLLCPVRPSLSRPAFSVPPGLFLTPVPSVPPVTPVAVCPATFSSCHRSEGRRPV